MIKYRLNQNDIDHLLTLTDLNDRKNYIQDKFNNNTVKYKFTLDLMPTGVGKTTLAIKFIKRLRKVTDELVIVIVPTKDLKENWLTKLEGVSNVEVYVNNSYTMAGKNYKCHTFIVDECHTISNEDSKFFSTALNITERQYTKLLTATIENKHISFLTSQGLSYINELSENDVKKLDLKPDSIIYNVPINFSESEKLVYRNSMNQIEAIEKYFSCLDLGDDLNYMLPQVVTNKFLAESWAKRILREYPESKTPVEKVKGVVIGYGVKFMKLVRTRNDYLNNTDSKIRAALHILEKENQKSFIFCNSIEAISKICEKNNKILPYHSKMKESEKKENMRRFLLEPDIHIASSRSLILGFDLETKCKQLNLQPIDVSLAINIGGKSSKIDFKQKSGRVERLDVNNTTKLAKTYNLYVEDYKLGEKTYLSQDKVWLKKATTGCLTQIRELDDI